MWDPCACDVPHDPSPLGPRCKRVVVGGAAPRQQCAPRSLTLPAQQTFHVCANVAPMRTCCRRVSCDYKPQNRAYRPGYSTPAIESTPAPWGWSSDKDKRWSALSNGGSLASSSSYASSQGSSASATASASSSSSWSSSSSQSQASTLSNVYWGGALLGGWGWGSCGDTWAVGRLRYMGRRGVQHAGKMCALWRTPTPSMAPTCRTWHASTRVRTTHLSGLWMCDINPGTEPCRGK